jgi:signal transduction histidine kinase
MASGNFDVVNWRSPSLRWQLVTWITLLAMAIQTAICWGMLVYQRADLGDLYDTRARVRTTAVAEELSRIPEPLTRAQLVDMRSSHARHMFDQPSLSMAVFEPDGTPVAWSDAQPPDLASLQMGVPEPNETLHVRDKGPWPAEPGRTPEPARYGLRRFVDSQGQERLLLVAFGDASFETAMADRARFLLLCIVSGTAATAVAAWIIAGTVTRPIAKLREVAESFTPAGIRTEVAATQQTSELKDFERELLGAREELRRFVMAQERFISNVSHEINTPIAVLLTEAQTMDPSSMSEEARAFVQSVKDEMRRLGRTVDGFLTLARLRSGSPAEQPVTCDVNDAVSEAVTACSGAAERHGVTVRAALARGGRAPLVTGEPDLLRSLLEHLIRNAIRFAGASRVVEVGVTPGNARWCVSVRDRGADIPGQDLAGIFDRFGQHPARSEHRGHGLGLAVAQGLAELHGGQIKALNMPEGGCEFIVELPAAPQTSEPECAPDASHSASARAADVAHR